MRCCILSVGTELLFGHTINTNAAYLSKELNLLGFDVMYHFVVGDNDKRLSETLKSALEKCDLSKISLFLMNEIEGFQITGEKEPDRILAKVKELYPKAKVVLTLGGDGSVYQDETGIYRQGIFKVKAVDTTAAGDTFTGYFISSVIDGMPVQDGLKLAAKASAIAVSRPGATASIPVRSEVVEK